MIFNLRIKNEKSNIHTRSGLNKTIQGQLKTLFMAVAFISFCGQLSGANEVASPYSFSASCASQGSWTQSALSATQNIRRITVQLKDDPNCKKLSTEMLSVIEALDTQMNNVQNSSAQAQRLTQVPAELNALRTFVQGSHQFRSQVLQLMMNKSIEGAMLNAQIGGISMSSSPSEISNNLLGLGSRVKASTLSGIEILNRVIDYIPQVSTCLAEDSKASFGPFLASAIQMTAAFVASNQDINGSLIAKTASRLVNYTREKKYNDILAQLNKQEFMSSMSCLLEVTTESYCQARDAMGLFESGMKSLNYRQYQGQLIRASNPFAGYYILHTHVPNITKWLQRVQIGVDPKLPTDAIFQNKILDEVVDYQKMVKSLLGEYNNMLTTVYTLTSLEARQNQVYHMIVDLTKKMTDAGFDRSQTKVNFFTQAVTELKIPFLLMGESTVPDQVSGKVMPQIDYRLWLQARIGELPAFKDPIMLAETIGNNLKTMIAAANIASIEYFNKWFIVDKSALAVESMTDINYTVKDSLTALNMYLSILKKRVEKYSRDKSILPVIVDTQNRIDKVLQRYQEIALLGNKYLNKKYGQVTYEETAKDVMVYEKLINEVFEQFMVMLAKSGFIANRMSNFVYNDYIILIQNKINFNQYQQELFTATGMAGLDQMLQIFNGNPSLVKADLNMALRLNKGNIEAVESLLRNEIVHQIAELNMHAQNRTVTSYRIAIDSALRAIEDFYKIRPNESELMNFLKKATPLMFVNLPLFAYEHSQRYPLGVKGGDEHIAVQSEYEDASYLRSQLCIQSLAFVDFTPFTNICKNAVLLSPMMNYKDYNVSYDQTLKAFLGDTKLTDAKQKQMNHSERICAYRNYHRKNMVLYMTLNKNK